MRLAGRPRWADLHDSSQEVDPSPFPWDMGTQMSAVSQSQESADDSTKAGLRNLLDRVTLRSPTVEEAPDVSDSAGAVAAAVGDSGHAPPGSQGDSIDCIDCASTPDPVSLSLQATCGYSPAVSAAATSRVYDEAGATELPAEDPLAKSKPSMTEGAATACGPGQEPAMPLSQRLALLEKTWESSTPVRKRSGQPGATPGKRLRSGPSEEWARRREKRQAAIQAIRATPEHLALAAARLGGDPTAAAAPRTPDATDSSVSKRQWEASVQRWRAGLRSWSAEHGPVCDSIGCGGAHSTSSTRPSLLR
mmetsp:Transcript_1657/g.3905  ORF Transcript_1657/g.3905 Transcript_1657/m.3905 type:complete len:306 (+) Transcript_1657:51-968(+)